MNSNIRVGRDIQENEIFLNLQRENLHSVILTGSTGSGKSIFHYYLYKQLIEQNLPEELGFVFMDMTRVDFSTWKTPYLYMPPIVDVNEALKQFEQLGDESIRRSQGISDTKRAIVIHIEEYDMITVDKVKFERAWLNITENKNKNNMYVVFSTSRPSSDVFTKTVLDNTDLKIVFIFTSLDNNLHILGKSAPENFTRPGEKILVYRSKELYSVPFSTEEVEKIIKFNEKMSSLLNSSSF